MWYCTLSVGRLHRKPLTTSTSTPKKCGVSPDRVGHVRHPLTRVAVARQAVHEGVGTSTAIPLLLPPSFLSPERSTGACRNSPFPLWQRSVRRVPVGPCCYAVSATLTNVRHTSKSVLMKSRRPWSVSTRSLS